MISCYKSIGVWGRSIQWCLALCGGGAVGVVSVGDAGAAIVYSGEKNIGITSDFNGVFINVTAPQSSTSANGLWDLNPFFGGLGIANSPGFQPVRIGTGNEAPILALSLGASVGGSLTYSSGWGGSGAEDDSGHLGAGAGQFTTGQTGYLGFKLLSGTDVHYGWMRVNLTSNGETGSVIDWAYDTSGSPILTGAVADLGAAPIVRLAGTEQTLSASQAGTGLLMEEGARVTFDEGTPGSVYAGSIQGTGEIKVAGAGGLRLSGVNAFSGTVAVLEGSRLTVGEAGNLGSAQVGIGSSGLMEFASVAANNGSANTFANAISLGGQSGTLNNSGSGEVVLSGSIAANGGLLVFTGGSFDVLGGISEAGSLIKEGTGTLELSGSTVNSYSGATTVTGGVLKLNKSGAGNGAVPGTLAVTSGGTVEIAASEQIGDSSAVTVGSGAVFSFSGSGMTETVGTFTNSGGDFSTGANNLVGTGNSIYWEGGTNTINDGGSVSDQHFVVTGGANTVEAGGVMTVMGGGPGLEFGGTSSPTILLNASGAVAGRMVLNGNVIADVASGTASILSIGAGLNPGSIVMGGGSRTVTVADGSAGADLLVTARMSDGSLIKEGAGTMELGAVNSLTGLTVNGGTVLLGVDNAVTGNVTMGGGTLALGGKDASAGVFTLSSASVLDMGGYAGSFTGSGAGLRSILTFANTNATDGWTGLKIFNWDGVSFTGGGNDQILFSSFSGDQMVFSGSEVQFYSDAGATVIGSGGELVASSGGGWELVPVPEPSTVAGVVGLIGMAVWRERRHLLRCPEAVAGMRLGVRVRRTAEGVRSEK